jgi:hypothetical protein
MRCSIVFVLFFLMAGELVKGGTEPQKFDKAAFYSVMASGDIDAIDNEIGVVKDASLQEKEGYEGALLMRKAGLVRKAKVKLNFFKAGRIKLETALLADNDNIEFHFLRLAIQEHAPKIVKYHSDIEKDKLLVLNNFKKLTPEVQHAILDYCKNSKVLHKEDFSLRSRDSF